LDLYERWIVHVRLTLCKNKFDDLFNEMVCRANKYWIDNHFGDGDFEDFE